MHTDHLSKTTITSFIATFLALTLLIATIPFVAADVPSADAPALTVPVTVDGVWSSGEWADAPQYTMTNSTGENIGYIRAKFNSSHLLVIIDSPWDTTGSSVYYHENVWLAFDTQNDGGDAPKTDDYLIHASTSWTNVSYVGNGTAWEQIYWGPNAGFATVQAGENWTWAIPLGSSPNNGTPHRISEMAVPLACVGSVGSTVGFYAQVDDDSKDPDGAGDLPSTAISEWPPGAGGDPPGWPNETGPAPCPAPSAWGDLYLSPHVWDIALEFGEIDIMDILVVAMAFGSEPGDPHWNPVADVSPDNLIDIMDILVIAMHFGESY